MRRFFHPAGQLATMSGRSHATGGQVPFKPESWQRDGWIEITEARFVALESAHAAEATEDAQAIADWEAGRAAAYRAARLAVLRGDHHDHADALLLGEPVPPEALGLAQPPIGAVGDRCAHQAKAADEVTKRHAPKSRGG